MSRLWDKGESTNALVLRFTTGRDYLHDARLIPYDIRASKAHAKMLAHCGHLQSADAEKLCVALDQIGEDNVAGKWNIEPEDEDCHTAIENLLVSRLGELGQRIHLGRSRNDQVLVALRLYYRDVILGFQELSESVVDSLRRLNNRHEGFLLPGYTHLQRAMPSSVQLWGEGFASEIGHSAKTFTSVSALVELNPLGSAAGYGTPGLELDQSFTTNELEFASIHQPVTAPQLSRGKAEAAMAFSLVLLLQDVGRLASDICLFSSQEFGFVRIGNEFTTGSSIMPQKRNPDVFEIIRGRSAQAPSDLAAILAITTKMTSGYHRDLQLIKETLFQMIDSATEVLTIMARALDEVAFVRSKVTDAMTPDLYAAQRAFELVKSEGISFRESYRRVAKALEVD